MFTRWQDVSLPLNDCDDPLSLVLRVSENHLSACWEAGFEELLVGLEAHGSPFGADRLVGFLRCRCTGSGDTGGGEDVGEGGDGHVGHTGFA